MELDEFKTYWNQIQDQEGEQQRITKDKIDQITMKTTDTLDALHQKSVYWNKMGKSLAQVLLGIIAVVLLIILTKDYFIFGKSKLVNQSLAQIGLSLIYGAVIVIYCVVTMWVYQRQQQIFERNNNQSLKAALTQTVNNFRKFYLTFNIIYLFLYPAYYYAVIKLLISYWAAPTSTILLTCGLLSIASLVLGHWYYKVKYINKIKLLEESLKELNEQS